MYKKSQHIPKKTTGANEQIGQRCRVKYKLTKISCVCIQQKRTTKKEIKKTIPFIAASKRMKELGIVLIKEMKNILQTVKHC